MAETCAYAGSRSGRWWLRQPAAAALVLAVVLGLCDAARPAELSGPEAASHAAGVTEPAQGAADDLAEKPVPLVVGVLLCAVVVAVFFSYGWLFGIKSSGGRVFQGGGLPPAQWMIADLLLVLLFFLILTVLPAPFVGGLMAGNIAKLATTLLILRVIAVRGQRPGDALGLGLRGLTTPMIRGLAFFLAFAPVFVAAILVPQELLRHWLGTKYEGTQEVVLELVKTKSPEVIIQIIVAAVLVAPVTEETLFRGFLYRTLRRYVRPSIAIAAGGVVFGVIHPPLPAQISMSIFGGLLCYLYERTGRLTVPIAVHTVFNLYMASVIMLFRIS